MAPDTSSRAALVAHAEFVEATLDSLDEGIVACDADGTLVLFNEATRRFHGLSEERLPPQRWAEHDDLYDGTGTRPLAVHEIPLFRALAGETVHDAAMVIAPKVGGPPRHVRVTGRQVRSADGTLLGAVVAMRDVTGHGPRTDDGPPGRRDAEQLRAAAVVGIAHDVRSPLASIVGFAELLDERPEELVGSGRLPEVTAVLLRQVAHIDALVGQLLDLGDPGAPPQPSPTLDDVRLDTLVRRVVAAHGYAGRVEVSTAGPVVVRADAGRVHRALGNLVANAIAHTHGPVVVTVAASPQAGVVTVRDHGPGLGEEPEELFGRLVRGRTDGPGHGLGLHLARLIAEEHGGALTGANAEGGGARFELSIPRAEVLRPPQVPPPAADRGAAARPPAEPPSRCPAVDHA